MNYFLILAGLLVCTLAANSFQCAFEMRQASMVEGGFVRGTFKYDLNIKQMSITYTTSGSVELYDWLTENDDQPYLFRWGTGCPCSISSLTYTQAVLTGPNTPAGTSIISTATYDGASFPLTASFKDGRNFQFSGCRATNSAGDLESKPSSCSCGMPLDIVLVLDRSSSIDRTEFASEKIFAQNIAGAFTISPTGVNIGITNFHTLTWDGPVTLLQGNNQQSVISGANALNCHGTAQCIDYGSYGSGSCCGMGTSISAGIVNGADMLATASKTGIRANAPKVMIVLTDGYHNRVLKFKPGTKILDTYLDTGKAWSDQVKVGNEVCNESPSQVSCAQLLLDDLDWAVNYAVTKVPGVTIYAIGVGAILGPTQLLHVARMRKENVFTTSDWAGLNAIFQKLVKVVCQSNTNTDTSQCNGCCGLCTCSGCIPPDGCDSQNHCTTTAPVGSCCRETPKDPKFCEQADKCKTYSCDATANNGQGDCKAVINPIRENTNCSKYECDPTTGNTVYTDLCPIPPNCVTNADCDDHNACTLDECVIPNPADKYSAFCRVTSTVDKCNLSDKCQTYSCDPKMGCTSYKNPLPADKSCETYSCDPKTGLINTVSTCPIKCETDTDCDDKNQCTIETCVLATPGDRYSAYCNRTAKPADACQGSDLCSTYRCDPIQGCLSAKNFVPADTNCTAYSCDPKDGSTLTKAINDDQCLPKPICVADTDCDDKNFCTEDKCVLDNPDDKRSAKCVWTVVADDYCDDHNACTRDQCVPATGCVNTFFAGSNATIDVCDDNNKCTLDVCDPLSLNATYPCNNTIIPCNKTDFCHEIKCYPLEGCVITDKSCPVTDNCTVSGCNVTEGCFYDDSLDCSPPIAVIAGLAAGVIAGIVVAAIAGALAVGGGTAYAFTQGAGNGLGASVANNPIYQPVGSQGNNPLHKV